MGVEMIRSSEVYLRDFLPNGLASVLIKSECNPFGKIVEGGNGELFSCKKVETTRTPGWFRATLFKCWTITGERDFLED